MKTSNFERLGYNENTALIPVKKEDDSASQISRVTRRTHERHERPRAIEYLSMGGDHKETVKDFILNSRQILKA